MVEPRAKEHDNAYRSISLWMLGYPEAALADANHALSDARDIGQAATLMYALFYALMCHIPRGNYAVANPHLDELVCMAEEKGVLLWKTLGTLFRGRLFGLTGNASDAVQMIAAGISALRSAGSMFWMPLYSSYLAKAYAELGKFDDAWRCIGEAMTAVEATKERWWEAEVNRTVGEMTLLLAWTVRRYLIGPLEWFGVDAVAFNQTVKPIPAATTALIALRR